MVYHHLQFGAKMAHSPSECIDLQPSPFLASLPLPLASSVVEFAAYNYTQELLPHARTRPGKSLKDVALVCKGWYHVVQQFMQQFDRETMEIKLVQGSTSELSSTKREVGERADGVRDLRVTIGATDSYRYLNRESIPTSAATEKADVDWTALLGISRASSDWI